MAVGTGYDPAGNRTSYTVTGASAALQMTPFVSDRQLTRLASAKPPGAGPKGPGGRLGRGLLMERIL